MSGKSPQAPGGVDADNPVEFVATTAQLETVFSDWLRQQTGLPAPVAYEAAWAMYAGRPVLRMRIWPVPNVVQFPTSPGGVSPSPKGRK